MRALLQSVITKLSDAVQRPGVMSLNGMVMEAKCRKAVAAYFEKITQSLDTLQFARFAVMSKNEGVHGAKVSAEHLVRRNSNLLQDILESHWMEAIQKADKQKAFHEAEDDFEDVDQVGMSGEEAAKHAKSFAGKAVKSINASTVKQIGLAVEDAIENQLGVSGLSKSLRELGESFTKVRADNIARTEMADAFGFASLEKLNREGIEYKQLIASPGACETCLSIIDNGPVPVDEPFVDDDGEEYDRSPIHNNCRCATVGARAPEGE